MSKIPINQLMYAIIAVVVFVQLVKFIAVQFSITIKGRWAILVSIISSLGATIIAAHPDDPWALLQVFMTFIGAGGLFSTIKSLAVPQPKMTGGINGTGRHY